ncbi:F-box family protein [Trifolium pratense]|uniref:F-box family protein n=1 Tax=Trifolium pratense TaxID=57577 RepID=A0A2K3JWU8_TRIPR|nr:F-box family protein [Trifolium pratense]
MESKPAFGRTNGWEMCRYVSTSPDYFLSHCKRKPWLRVLWNLVWRRRLFVWEANLLDELLMILNPTVLSSVADRWGWRPELGEEFSVKSTYVLVSNLIISRGVILNEEQSAYKAIWKGPTPSKVSGFSWMVLHDRVPTRVNLFRRRIIQEDGDQRCLFRGEYAETATHLFLYCSGIHRFGKEFVLG